MSVAAPTLTGTHVQLEQLRAEFAEELAAAGNEDRSTYGWTAVPPTVDGMRRYITGLLDDQQARTVVPFAQRRISDGALVGCTRYLRLEWWSGGDLPAEVEIGGTWLAASAQRTPINTEAKYLLLANAFDDWNVHRVVHLHRLAQHAEPDRHPADRCTRSRASCAAIAGSYAPGEENTVARDSAMYSVIRSDWPTVKSGLEARLR